ncbi:C39 family peptidase [Methylocaldum szegediense]|uniref:Peptidase C39 domain-containing protein n=1 Tax=Methylocaldum szegediense TaxID=73780 RepID=A0ABN8XA01_9GAMM|nr:C39 family peptidase [Methylocaldum szegediense]CAI8967742.1 Peptidase C39 domain-containing protein [Methylocaldum szegediense]
MNGRSGLFRLTSLFAVCLAGAAPCSHAGAVQFSDGVVGPGFFDIKVTSFAERRFKTILKQQYDFSCGSAALASLLSFHYEDMVGELDVFADMWEHGDQQKIKQQGFSLLDMKRYLERRGYKADGYKIGLKELIQAKVPAITIINNKGYMHFVIVKGANDNEVLVGDPALGLKRMDRQTFTELWENRILFIIRNKKNIAGKYFNNAEEWSLSPKAPLGVAVDNGSLASFNLLQPGRYDF